MIEDNDGRICGIFTKDQLDRELVSSYKKQSFFSNISARWLGLWLFLSSPFYSVKAQTSSELSSELKTTKVDTNRFYISGTVISENNEPQIGLKVKIVELGLRALTDYDGNFHFVFDDNLFGNYSLEVRGYEFLDTIRINNISVNTSDVKIVVPEEKLFKEIEMVGIVIVEPKFDVFEPKTWTPRRHKRSRSKN